MQAERTASDPIASAAQAVRRRIADGAPRDEIRWIAAVLCARFCGQIIDGELVIDSAKAAQFKRALADGRGDG